MIGWRNGEWFPLPDGAEVSVVSPGPCLFETFALRGGKVECLPDHLARLVQSCPRLGIDSNWLTLGAAPDPVRWAPVLREILRREQLTDAIVRLIVAPRAMDTLATEWVTVRPLPATPPAIRLQLLQTRRDAPEWLPRPKSGPWQNSSVAWRELRAISHDTDIEGVQLDATGHVAEATRSSLAWWDGTHWCFPAASTGRLGGTAMAQFRGVVLAAGRKIAEVAEPFPPRAESVVVLRSTLAGGGVLSSSCSDAERQVCWQSTGPQTEARAMLAALAAWRAQRCINLA
ncbi:MAG: aminotransferase class IV [Verrucomicrobiota bacterium]|jgi:branched-subunit amino acid aminotransferase/4-amino-4-deoxychorismate lyase